MKARLVNALRRDQARAANEFGADGDPRQRVLSRDFFSFGNREHRRHDHRAGVHRPALEGVVEVLAVRRGAVHEGRARGIERARMSDGGAGSRGFPRRERRDRVVGLAGRAAQAGDVDQQLFGGIAECRGTEAGALDPGGEALADRFRRRFAHAYSPLRILAASTIAFILPKADSRGRDFMPQSGPRMMFFGFSCFSAFLIRPATVCGVSTSLVARSMQPTIIFLLFNDFKTEQSSLGCAVSITTLALKPSATPCAK